MQKRFTQVSIIAVLSFMMMACSSEKDKTAAEILGNPDYLAMSYGGYRTKTRKTVPTVAELKEDMLILSAMGVKMIRTYNTQQFAQAENILKAIRELKKQDASFEMYVMLGAWIDCKNAWTDLAPDHNKENFENNSKEIGAAVRMANTYSDIVKVIAVGNESMVHWAASYFVYPDVILKWVNHLQGLKKTGQLPKDLWITSSDNHASWGGEKAYHNDDLVALIKAVDFISLHTYPFHDTHYNSKYWVVPEAEDDLLRKEKVNKAMQRAVNYAKNQYQAVADYLDSLGIEKPIHIGETGWASVAATHYDEKGSRAADEYKQKLFYDQMRKWTNEAGISLFYFEAFDEPWKDAANAKGSENHFGLITVDGQAKYALWDMVDQGVFEGLMRNNNLIVKSFRGNKEKIESLLLTPPNPREIAHTEFKKKNDSRTIGEKVTEEIYVVYSHTMIPSEQNKITYPSAESKLNAWEGTCLIERKSYGPVEILTGKGKWWGCAMELQAEGKGEDLSGFADGFLNFEIKGETEAEIKVGFQTGVYSRGDQTNNFVTFNTGEKYKLTNEWTKYRIPVAELNKGAKLNDVTAPIFFRSDAKNDRKKFLVKSIYYSMK